MLASLDGAIGPLAETRIPVTDEGLLRGDGGFEVARLYGGPAFALGGPSPRPPRPPHPPLLRGGGARPPGRYSGRMLASLDGPTGPRAETRTPVPEGGLRGGGGGCEVARLYGGRPFAMDDHYARLQRTCNGLRLE